MMTDEAVEALAEAILLYHANPANKNDSSHHKMRIYQERAVAFIARLAALGWELRKKEQEG